MTFDDSTIRALTEIANRYGTPAYAFDVRSLRGQVELLEERLPSDVVVYYSLKANASLGICQVFANCDIGADVASTGELATAKAAGFDDEKIFVAGPYKMPETIAMLHEAPAAIVSVDSLSELETLSDAGLTNRAVLRLRPDFGSCAVVQAGSESRFGFTSDDFARCRDRLPSCGLDVIGFHVFAGSQVLNTEELCGHLRRSMDLALRAADALRVTPTLINLGGGFGIPYGPAESEFDLAAVSAQLDELLQLAKPAGIMLELGRYLVAKSGYYLTSVAGHQTFQGRPAVIVDGGVHQRADMCGLHLRRNQNPPLSLNTDSSLLDSTALTPTDVLGCLSLPDDVMLEACPLPELSRGDVLAFVNAGAYGLWSSPSLFHSSPLPAEVAFDGESLYLMRERRPAQSVLDGQRLIYQPHTART